MRRNTQTRSYEVDPGEMRVSSLIQTRVVDPMIVRGYSLERSSADAFVLAGSRRPRWAIVLAVFLFPLGLLLLLIKRPRRLRLVWDNDEPVTVTLEGEDGTARHLLAAVAIEHQRPPGFFERSAPPFAAGSLCVLIAWIAGVQLIDGRGWFIAAIGFALALGSGIGTLLGMRRATRMDDPPSPIKWGTLPALAGGIAMTLVFVALVLFLLAVGAGE